MKNVLLISAFVLATFWGSAQSLFIVSQKCSQSTFSYGPKVGINLSNLSLKEIYGDVIENPMQVGFVVGGFVNYNWSSWIGIQGELLYSRQGSDLRGDGTKGSIHLDYINIPILAKFYVFDQFSIEAGPQLGLRVSKKFKGDARSLEHVVDLHSADMAIAMGAAYDFDFGLTIDLRYNLGLVNTMKAIGSHSVKSKNGVMQLTAAWNF